jgi:hypothetical protein
LKLERKLVLGRHRLDIRQPLASASRLKLVEQVTNQLQGSAPHASSSNPALTSGRNGRNADPENQLTRESLNEFDWDMVDAEDAHETDSMLQACEYHEVF